MSIKLDEKYVILTPDQESGIQSEVKSLNQTSQERMIYHINIYWGYENHIKTDMKIVKSNLNVFQEQSSFGRTG